MLDTLDRLKKANELRDASLNAAATPEGNVQRRIALERRAESLRELLLGRSERSIKDLDLFDVGGSVSVLNERVATVQAGGDPVDAPNTAGYVRILGNRLRQIANLTGDMDGAIKADDLNTMVSTAYMALASKPHQVAMADRFLAQPGAKMVDDAIAQANQGLSTEEIQRATMQEKLRAERDRLENAYAANRKAIRDTRATLKAEYEAGRLPMKDYLSGCRIMDERAAAVVDAINRELLRKFGTADIELLKAGDESPLRKIARELINQVAEVSPVTAQQATDWAAKQEVTASAKAALKRIGYAPDKLREDVAQFYRLTAGRLANVRIKASAGRASASEIHGHKNRTINMGAGFCKRTLFHELGHHLEADPQVFAAARGFLIKRRESETVYSLRSLTGNPGYRRDEVAFKDSWVNPYVGKHYKYDVTEVISMGMEAFSSDEAMAQYARDDPQHLKLIAGFLTASQDPLFDAVKQVFAQQADAEEDIAEESEKVIEKSLKELGAGIKFTKLEQTPDHYMPGMVYSGTWNSGESQVDLYAGKARDPVTRRLRNGFRLVGTVKGGGWRTVTSAFSMDEVRAVSRIFAKEGRFVVGLTSSAATVTKYAASYGAAA